ncbi:MAG TPA: CBS domain-containing protein [Longimicrobiales bacterium]
MREMRAGELMTPDPITVTPDTPIAEVAREFRIHDIGFLPIVDGDRGHRLLGVITDRDIACRCTAEGHDPTACPAERHMTREVATARAGDDVNRVMEIMQGAQVRRLPVVSDTGRLIGVIAQADLAVDAVEEDAVAPIDVAYTVERISEPAHPERKHSH